MDIAMKATRDSHHQCLIGYQVAMFRLMMLGMSAANADRFLRCLPLAGDA